MDATLKIDRPKNQGDLTARSIKFINQTDGAMEVRIDDPECDFVASFDLDAAEKHRLSRFLIADAERTIQGGGFFFCQCGNFIDWKEPHFCKCALCGELFDVSYQNCKCGNGAKVYRSLAGLAREREERDVADARRSTGETSPKSRAGS